MRNVTLTTLRATVMLAVALGSAAGQTRQQPQPKLPPSNANDINIQPGGILVSTDQDYRIGPRDVIEVRIEDANELSGTYQINADGTFLMPYLKRIKAQDKTPEELSNFIADGLRNRYLKDPQVMVAVKQFYSRTFFIQGEVKNPGVYQMEGRPSLFILINIAGGLTEKCGSTAFIIREVNKKGSPAVADAKTDQAAPVAATQSNSTTKSEPDLPDYTLKTVNIAGLYKGRFDQNAYVEPGDIVNIPKADVFFVAGEVKSPGPFVLSEGTTLRQAMALSQGPTLNAKLGDGVIMRTDPNTGVRQEIHVDIGAVMKTKKDDVPLMANDIVIVGNSRAKTVGNAILKAFGMAAAQRGVVP